ncbi:TRAP transporter small permease [Halomonas colorata]|uniref:TRAP transporter small permease n=1 Tax=Halomonas colorata TaxID=2742615 RepID=UPI001866298C|nr:TRAP transporter small permease subunit [Halomonas colorata]
MTALVLIKNAIEIVCRYIAGIGFFSVMLVTVTDVVTRYLFKLTSGAVKLTVSGSVEIVSFVMLISLLAAMAANKEISQVVVEAFTHKLADSLKKRIAGFYLLGFFLVGFFLSWGLWEEGVRAAQFGEVSQDLAIPMGLIYKTSAILSAFFSIRCLIQSVLGMVYSHDGGEQNEF